jgi:branched-chain amino acid transport system substrate-binding protein
LTFDRSQTDFSPQIGRISSASAEAIFLWGEPDSSARLLRSLRGKGISLPVFGPPVFSLPSFLEKAGSAADGLMTCRLAWGNDETRSTEFARDFEERFGEKPSDDAAVAYDAATIVIEAVRKAGLNRARIRDAVSEMSGFVGIAGKITWDNGGGNVAVPQSVALHRGWLCAIEE